MATLHLLGAGAVVSDPDRTTTMMALDNGSSVLLVDCGGDVAPRLEMAGLDPTRIHALVVTHEHPDHVGGFPLLMERLWLMGRRDPLPVYGIAPALAQVRRLHDTFDVSGWEGYPGFTEHEIPFEADAPVLEEGDWRVTAAPGRHAVPVVGLRFEDLRGGGVATYGCDTAPSSSITALANDCDLLLHEATGEGPVHSSAEQATRAALEAKAKRLVLVHLPRSGELARDLPAARAVLPDVEVGEEMGRYSF